MDTEQQITEKIGNNDLRFRDGSGGGFHQVILEDADDGDVIVISEDDIIPLVKRLQRHIKEYNL